MKKFGIQILFVLLVIPVLTQGQEITMEEVKVINSYFKTDLFVEHKNIAEKIDKAIQSRDSVQIKKLIIDSLIMPDEYVSFSEAQAILPFCNFIDTAMIFGHYKIGIYTSIITYNYTCKKNSRDVAYELKMIFYWEGDQHREMQFRFTSIE